MNYIFEEDEFRKNYNLAEKAFCNSKVLLEYCIHKIDDDESFFIIKPIVEQIKQQADLLYANFINKSN